MSGDRLARRRALGARREKLIRDGLAPGCVWIAFPSRYARQLLRELDMTRDELREARAALARLDSPAEDRKDSGAISS